MQSRVPLQLAERNRVVRPTDYSTNRKFSFSELYAVHSATATLTAANLHRDTNGAVGLFIDRCSLVSTRRLMRNT